MPGGELFIQTNAFPTSTGVRYPSDVGHESVFFQGPCGRFYESTTGGTTYVGYVWDWKPQGIVRTGDSCYRYKRIFAFDHTLVIHMCGCPWVEDTSLDLQRVPAPSIIFAQEMMNGS
jgi:hypothetical protein